MTSRQNRTFRRQVVLAFGTRPEAIKMAPVYQAFLSRGVIEPVVLLTGQHREQLEQALSIFDVNITANLDVMTDRQGLTQLAGRILPAVSLFLDELDPDYVLVHGDTLTTFCVAWAAYLERIPVGHVEAGLRTHNLSEPFPEEANRRLTDAITDLDLAPTRVSRDNLIHEGKPPDRIVVTGQTGIDAIAFASERGSVPQNLPPAPYVTVTMHRRENWPILAELAGALAHVAHEHPEFTFVFPVHLNPVVRNAVEPILSRASNFRLLEPLSYGSMAALLSRSRLIVTDSGGLQEEGAALNVPVVVLRNVTERPEGLESGRLILAGTDPNEITRIVGTILDQPSPTELAPRPHSNPYGDGRASQRVAQAVEWRLGLADRPDDWAPTQH